MRLYLAVAALMLTFVAFAEAQEDTLGEKLTNFGNKMSEFGRTVASSATETVQRIRNSDAMVTAKNWFDEKIETMRRGLERMTQ